MSNDIVVTKEQVRDLIKLEKLKPEDLFDDEGLKPIRDAARSEGYAEGSFSAGWEMNKKQKAELEEKKQAEEKGEGPDKYLDPARNPMIRTGDE